MSDEDKDIDVESDEEFDGFKGYENGNTQYMTQAEKRAHHNALERKRRDHIKDSFNSLRDVVPNLEGDKVATSRAQILKSATEYIQFMTEKNSTVHQDIGDLKRQNLILEQQIRGLERAKSAGNFASQSINLTIDETLDLQQQEHSDSEEESSDIDCHGPSPSKKLKTKAT